MATDIINNDLHVAGSLSARSFTPPAGSVANASIEAAAGIVATKLEHQHAIHYAQVPGSAIVAATQDVHIVRGATGDVVALEAALTGALADHVSRTVTVDLHKSTGGGSFATVLTSTIGFTSSSTLRTAVAAVVNSAGLVDGDILRIVVTVAGGSGNQAQGLQVTLTIREDAD